jgi:hypothetical protein
MTDEGARTEKGALGPAWCERTGVPWSLEAYASSLASSSKSSRWRSLSDSGSWT